MLHTYLVSLFWSFDGAQGKKDLVAVDSTEHDDENGDMRDSDNEVVHDEHSASDIDSDEERRRFFFLSIITNAKVEEYDRWYHIYLSLNDVFWY